jgi:hypothetical protein
MSSGRTLPLQHSVLAAGLLVRPEGVLKSTVPMPMFFAKQAPKSGPLGLRGLIRKLKPERPIGPPSSAPQA